MTSNRTHKRFLLVLLACLIGSPIVWATTLRILHANQVQVANSADTQYTTLKSATSLATNNTFALPPNNGTNGYVLQTDGTGNTSWAPASSSSGTVTSVAATVPAFMSITGSPITSSGTLALGLSGTALPVANGGTGATTSTGSGSVVLSSSPTLITPALGTPSAAVLTNATGLPLATGVTGTLPVGNGGTGVTSSTGTGSVVLSTSPTLVTPALGTPSSGVATNITGLPLTTGVTGVLGVTHGGTGATAYSTGSIPYYDGTILNQDNSGLFWDGTNHRLGIGTSSPQYQIDVNEQGVTNNGIAFENLPNNGVWLRINPGTGNEIDWTVFGGVRMDWQPGGSSAFQMNDTGGGNAMQLLSRHSRDLYLSPDGTSATKNVKIAAAPGQTAPIAEFQDVTPVTVAQVSATGDLIGESAQLSTTNSRPSCTSGIRGTLWVVQGGVGVTDTLSACLKSAANSYSWVQVVTGG